MGGIQGVAAMTFGLFGLPRAKILVGPGNQFVAEAKRQVLGRVGIDSVAGPSEVLIVADTTARADWLAASGSLNVAFHVGSWVSDAGWLKVGDASRSGARIPA